MKKNGHTAAGAQRWKCTSCALSTTSPSGRARRHEQADELADFIAWATSRHTQDEQEGSARAFRRRTCWCWQVPVPHPPVTGQVHDQIFIDGIHLSGGWVLLIARDREHVLEWQWAANESAQAYTALLERLAPADVVTTDGAAGALAWGCAQVVDGLFMRLLSRPLGVVRIRWGICRPGWCGCGGGCRSLRSRWRPRCRPGRVW